MENAFKNIAVRLANAEQDFIEVLTNLGGITEAEAKKVLTVYLRRKMVRVDFVMGRIGVKQGSYLDRDYITSALANTTH